LDKLQGGKISEKELCEKLRESEDKYRNIIELAPDGIITADTKGVGGGG
jgi:PAS domain-containing protein